jgi:hypothetical protein
MRAEVVHNVSTFGRPGATRTRIGGLGHRCPGPLDDGPVETHLGVEPSTAGLQSASRASETCVMAPSGRFERPTSRLRKTVLYPLSYKGMGGR